MSIPSRRFSPSRLAPVCTTDGDGQVEGAALVERARLPGVTSHRIGEDVLSGGLRDCGQGPELVAASADWSRLLVIGWDGGPVRRDAGAFSGRALQTRPDCR